MDWDRRALTRFWGFVGERHEIFRRRVLLKQPPLWTEDKILASVKFTNIYRDLDRETRKFLHRIPSDAAAGDRFFNIAVFRSFTWTPTYDALGGFCLASAWDTKRATEILTARQAQGNKIYTGAFMYRSGQTGPGGKVKTSLDQIQRVQERIDLLTRDLLAAPTAQEAHGVLTGIPGIGGFLGAEILIDACYPEIGLLPEVWLDQWIFIGPGAIKGLRLLTGHPLRRKEADAALVDLRDNQRAMIGMAGARLHGPPLTLEGVEQAVCEFQKYERARTGGRVKRGYSPAGANADLSPWDDIPQKYRDPQQWLTPN